MPVRAVTGPIQQLPAEANEFVGRTAELDNLARLLGSARLITLVGPGGVGKTRLALRAARQAEPSFAHGVCLVDLSALHDPRLLANAVADRLGLAQQSTASRRDAVIGYLRDRQVLLVLDTCEHLTRAVAELVEAVLAVAPGVTFVATSRKPLGVAGERCLPVAPLPVPGLPVADLPAPGPLVSSGAPSDAVDLFVRRASRTADGFAVTEDNQADLIRICQLLQGVPLSIELAAQVGRRSPADLAERLDHRLHQRLPPLGRDGLGGSDSLDGPDSLDAAARPRTLRDSVGWLYELCTPEEQALWARLSVFEDGFDLAAAAEICASATLPHHQVIETVTRLAEKSVLWPAVDDSGQHGQPRYRMLDTIREFGAGLLAASGSETAVRDRQVARYLAQTRHFRDHFLGDEQLALIRELGREHANLRAVLAYTLGDQRRSHSPYEGAEIAIGLAGYWMAAGLQREGEYWLDRVLERFPEPTPQRAEALAVRCWLGTEGRGTQAAADGRESVRLATALGDERIAARGYLFLANALTETRELAEAMEAGAEAERLLTLLGDRVGLLLLPIHMAHLHQIAGNLTEADAWYLRGVELFGDTRERWQRGCLELAGGFTFAQQGRSAECVSAFRLALLFEHEAGDIISTGYALEALALVAWGDGRHRRACWLLGAADPLWSRAGAVLSNDSALVELHDLVLADTRQSLGDQAFDALFGRGARLSLDQAVTLAIEDADEAPASEPAA
jgi:predicted ATPase